MKNLESTQFEPLIHELGAVIESIESDKADMAESLTAYENGIRLVRLAQSYLAQAEQRVELLNADDDCSEASVEE